MTADGAPELRGNLEERTEYERQRRLEAAYTTSPYCRKIWRPDSPASRLMVERKWALITALLAQEGIDLRSARVLDLGVGVGADGERFKDLGARADRFLGLDFLQRCARGAREKNPWMSTIAGDACRLPLPAARFDLVYQSTMLSSVPQPDRRAAAFREIDRVLAPGGVFLSFDTRYPNPWNPHTRPLPARVFRDAFPGWPLTIWSNTAIPQLQRALAPYSIAACRLLERIPFLRSHLLVLARKV